MRESANDYLDLAERALVSALGHRRQSQGEFLHRLLGELDEDLQLTARSPAQLFRSVLSNRHVSHLAGDALKVLAMPGQRPESALRAGDWMVRAVPGTGDVGQVSILASADLLTPSEFESEGIVAESQQPGQYGLVVEAIAIPHRRSRRFARRVLDSRGRVPPHTMMLRPQYPQPGAMLDLPPDKPEWDRQFKAKEPEPEEEGAALALSLLVIDERGRPLVAGEYAVYQGGRSERGDFANGGNGLALLKTIDAAQAFTFEVRDRVCAICEGAFIDPDDPAIEYGGTWFDWTLVRDNKSPQTAFWPHYLAEMKADGSRRSVDRFWQHEHIVRRPIRAVGAAGGANSPVRICAVPANIRTGPIVRYTDHQRASVWLEPATPSLVKLRVKRAGGREAEKTAYASTVRVGGRHFAIVEVDGLDPDTFYLYTLELAPMPATGSIPVDAKDFDGVFPQITPDVRRAMRQQLCEASVEQIEWLSFRTLRPRYDKSLRFATGSCRWYPGDVIGGDDKKPKDWGPDMLDKLGEWLRKTPRAQWPHFQFYGGDQIYADEIGDGHHAELIRARFASRLPGPQDTSTSVADRLVDGAWAGRFAHRLKPASAPLPELRKNVLAGIEKLKAMYAEHPVLRLIAAGHVTERQLHAQYQTLLTRRRDVQRASSEANDERQAREAINLLPQLKQLLVTGEPFRVYRPYWDAVPQTAAFNRQAYRYRSCNFLLWSLPVAEADLPTLQDQTAGDVGVRGAEGRGHDSADRGRHVADFAEYAFLYERAWTTSPNVRTLLGNVPTFLMLDDHEVTDDWNFDAAWVRMVHSRRDHYRMWPKTITDALCAYWMYQGLGNKARSHWQLDRDPRAEVLARAQRAGIDALPELRKCIYSAVMAAPPTDAEAPFQTGTSLKWHYQLPFQPPFLVPDCRTRKRLVPGDEKMKQIDHERKPPQSETIDAEQIKWLREALNGCKSPVAFIAPSTPLLMQKAVLKIMSQPESYARAWIRDVEGETAVGLALALLAGGASLDLIHTFRRVKDLEHMIRDKSWRDLWGLAEEMHRNRSPVKTLVLVSGDVHHSYCMTGNLSGHGRPLPELLQITSSGLQTTIRRGMQEALGEALSDLSFGFARRHLVPGFMTKAGSRRRELALYRNAVAIVDVSLGAEVDVRVIHLASDEKNKDVDQYVYQYTSGPAYMKMGEPANTPYRLGAPTEAAEGLAEGAGEPRVVIDEAALDFPEDESIASEDSPLDEDTIGFPFDLRAGYSQTAAADFLPITPDADVALSEDRQNPPLPERCDSAPVSVAASGDDAARLEKFEREIMRWVATCVSSGREVELVRGNPSLRRVWDSVRERRGQTVSVLARYQFTPVTGGVRAQSVTFSTPVPVQPQPDWPAQQQPIVPAQAQPVPLAQTPTQSQDPPAPGPLVIDRPANDADNDIVLIIVTLQKPGDVAQYWADEVRPNRTRWAHALSELEQSYIDTMIDPAVPAPLRMRTPVDPARMTTEEADAARRLFGTGADAARRYANYENRRRILANYVYTHPATVRLQLGLYRLVRDVNPIHFAFERGWQIGGGREMFTGQEVSRLGAAFEFVASLALVYGVGKVLQATRPAAGALRTAPRALTDPIYDLPAEGGGMRVNNRWYTEHALERMAPDTPEVRAQIRTRMGQRLERLGIASSHPAYNRILARALQKIDPRGVPPSVVEAEILRPGSTNVRVITARRGEVVVTVIRR